MSNYENRYEQLHASQDYDRGKVNHWKIVKMDASQYANEFKDHERWLCNQDPYKQIIADADSDKVKYSSNISVNVGDRIVQGMDKIYKKRYDYLYYRVKPDQNDLYISFDKPGFGFDREKIDFYAKRKVYESEPDWDDDYFHSNAIDVAKVRGYCTKYNDVCAALFNLQNKIHELKAEIGNDKIHIDDKGYDIVIDYLNERITESLKLMHSMSDAIYNRVPFLHEFQVRLQRDYKRYYDSNLVMARGGGYTSSGRESNGWD